MGVVGRDRLQILAIMLELCLSQIACYYAQNYARIIIASLVGGHNVAHKYTSSFVAREPTTMTFHASRGTVKTSLSWSRTCGKMAYQCSSKRKHVAVASAFHCHRATKAAKKAAQSTCVDQTVGP